MEGLKIIIADDEALIRLDLREMLTEAGHTVLELDDSQCDTIGGWVYTQLNTQPQIGQTVKLPKAEITVEEVEALRITRLKIKLLSALNSVNQGMLDEHLNKD